MGPSNAAAWVASRYGGRGCISDDTSVRHFRSRGGRASGRGERVGGQHGWPEIGVRPERLREKGDE